MWADIQTSGHSPLIMHLFYALFENNYHSCLIQEEYMELLFPACKWTNVSRT
jgi:hypothetical protein